MLNVATRLNNFFFFNDTATTEIYTLSLHDALPIFTDRRVDGGAVVPRHVHEAGQPQVVRSEEHTSELQSRQYLVCRLLLEKKKDKNEAISAIRYRYPSNVAFHRKLSAIAVFRRNVC